MATLGHSSRHSSLPVELIESVLGPPDHPVVGRDTLLQCCYSSRMFCEIAQSRLFYSVDLTNKRRGCIANVRQPIRLTSTLFQSALRSRPFLAKHVSELVVSPTDAPDDFYETLLMLHSLQSLHILDPSFAWFSFGKPMTTVLLDFVFPRLRTLKIERIIGIPFITILGHLSNLQKLHLINAKGSSVDSIKSEAICPRAFHPLHMSSYRRDDINPRDSLSDALRVLRVKILVLHADEISKDPADFLSAWILSFGRQLCELQLDWDFCSNLSKYIEFCYELNLLDDSALLG
ncbi:hypothetical protein DL96DRAFT_1589374, partial [Flagelloscypha sp. PMI_526]